MDYASTNAIMIRPVSSVLDRIQSILSLDFLHGHIQFQQPVTTSPIPNEDDHDNDDHDVDANDTDNTNQRERTTTRTTQPQPIQQGGLGRIGLISTMLGIVWGIHLCLVCLLPILCFLWIRWSRYTMIHNNNNNASSSSSTTPSTSSSSSSLVEDWIFLKVTTLTMIRLWTWCFYILSLSTFHLLEFFVTCIYNPTVVTSESFLINHSKAYTIAALLATTEFWIKFIGFSIVPILRLTAIFQRTTNANDNDKNNLDTVAAETEETTPTTNITVTFILIYIGVTIFGVLLVVLSQGIRSYAMAQCGESFNHFIQTQRKQSHQLVTTGIYRYLRHPSYVGFYYWSIGTQIVLHNWICVVLFAFAGYSFFQRRIPYEERTLIQMFGPQYDRYVQTTYIGIPFISTSSLYNNNDNNINDDDDDDGGHNDQDNVTASRSEKDSNVVGEETNGEEGQELELTSSSSKIQSIDASNSSSSKKTQ